MIRIIMPSQGLSPRSAWAGAKQLVLITSFILSFFTASAVVTTHDLEGSYKGYSIEKVPGADEFIAVGTMYRTGLLHPNSGYQVMHLDNNGNVIASKIVTLPPASPNQIHEVRVVDVAVEDNDNYWVIMAMRDNVNSIDFCYAEKFSLSTMNVSTTWPWQLTIGNMNDASFPHLYPTHSVYMAGHLYICGYVSGQTPSASMPTAVSPMKQGMMSATDVAPIANPFPTVPTTNLALWETQPATQTQYDYDMALKINVEGDHLYVTGNGNLGLSNNQRSGAIFIHFTASSLLTIGTPSVTRDVIGMQVPMNYIHGIHGVDVVRRGGDILILTNSFSQNGIAAWGVLRIDPVTGLPDPALPSYATTGFWDYTNPDWVKQLLLHPTDPDNGFASIIGEAPADFTSCSTPGTYIPPNNTNINPYILTVDFAWNPIAGPTGGLNVLPNNLVVHASNDDSSTYTTNLDYTNAMLLGYRHNLENQTRLHTFACRYDDNTADGAIAMIYPKKSEITPDFLNTKFIRTDGTGHEQECANEWNCMPTFAHVATVTHTFNIQYGISAAPQPGTLTVRRIGVDEYYCADGHYKTTGIYKATSGKEWSMYPNPAVTELNLIPVAGAESYSFTLTDITGKEVLSSKGAISGNVVTLSLHGLASGVYIATYSDGTTTNTQKLVINK